MERDLDHACVGDGQDVPRRVAAQNFVQGSIDPGFGAGGAFSTGYEVPVGLLGPPRPCLGETLRYLVGAEAFPFAKVDLPETSRGIGFEVDQRLDGLCSLKSALQVARVEARQTAAGEPASQQLGLAAALAGQRRIPLALDAVLAVPGRLAVANQDHPGRRSRARWDGFAGLGRLRERGSDLDIYTNFLLIPRSGWADLRRIALAGARLMGLHSASLAT